MNRSWKRRRDSAAAIVFGVWMLVIALKLAELFATVNTAIIDLGSK